VISIRVSCSLSLETDPAPCLLQIEARCAKGTCYLRGSLGSRLDERTKERASRSNQRANGPASLGPRFPTVAAGEQLLPCELAAKGTARPRFLDRMPARGG